MRAGLVALLALIPSGAPWCGAAELPVLRGILVRIEIGTPRLIVQTESGKKVIVHVDLQRSWIQTGDDAFRSLTDLRVGHNVEIICEPDGANCWAILVCAWAGFES